MHHQAETVSAAEAVEPGMAVSVREALEAQLGAAPEAGLTWRPQNTVEVDEGKAASLIKMIDAMEDLDDVQAVFSNFEASDEVMEKLAAAS